MKNLSYCDSIDHILVSQKINCDALIVSAATLQYTILYRSNLLHIFTDNLIKTTFEYITRESFIHGLSKMIHVNSININQVSKTLSKINKSFTVFKILCHTTQYFNEKKKLSQLDSPNYIKFYNAVSDSYIWLNKDLLNINFVDTIQTKINIKDIEGLYINSNTDHQIAIYSNPFDGIWKIENRQATQNFM